MARFALDSTTDSSNRVLRSSPVRPAHCKTGGLEKAQNKLYLAFQQRKKALAQQQNFHQEDDTQNHCQQEATAAATDDLQTALLASATMATKRAAFLSKPQLQRSHERLKRNVQRRQEQLLVQGLEALNIHDSPSPTNSGAQQAFPLHIIEQVQAYDALALARAKIAKQDRRVVQKMEKLHIHSPGSSPSKITKRESSKKSPSPVSMAKRGNLRGILKKSPSPPSMNLETKQNFAATDMHEGEAAMASIPPRSSQKRQVRFAPEAILSTWEIVEGEEKQVRFAPEAEFNTIEIEKKGDKHVRFAPMATLSTWEVVEKGVCGGRKP